MVQVVTAIFGAYDAPKPILDQSVDCTFTLVTDIDGMRATGWTAVHENGHGAHPRLAAKGPKLKPWDYTVGEGPWVWIDGSFSITSHTFIAEALAASEGATLAQWTHPWRNCIYEEAIHSAVLPKYKDQPIRQQADHYRTRVGHPAAWGLWATGLIVYRERCDYLADLWWAEMNQWGYQDQISQPVALRAAGLRPAPLPGGLHASPWLKWHPHRSEQ